MVLVLVLLPPLAGALGGTAAADRRARPLATRSGSRSLKSRLSSR